MVALTILILPGNMKYDNEGHAIICGFEYSPIRQIRISPNYQSWKSSKGKRENFLLLSVECKFENYII